MSYLIEVDRLLGLAFPVPLPDEPPWFFLFPYLFLR